MQSIIAEANPEQQWHVCMHVCVRVCEEGMVCM